MTPWLDTWHSARLMRVVPIACRASFRLFAVGSIQSWLVKWVRGVWLCIHSASGMGSVSALLSVVGRFGCRANAIVRLCGTLAMYSLYFRVLIVSVGLGSVINGWTLMFVVSLRENTV